jgi:hypothetical protein
MGTVYRAEQTQLGRRQVALKLIKVGTDSRAVLARFDAERQALAIMSILTSPACSTAARRRQASRSS